jgi:hypothetical protein
MMKNRHDQHCGWWLALALSVLGHGFLLQLLMSGIGSKWQSDVADGVLTISFENVPMIASLVELVDLPQSVQNDFTVKPTDPADILKQKTHLSEHIQRDSVVIPEGQQDGFGCSEAKLEVIRDVGQSNFVGRREQEFPCTQG